MATKRPHTKSRKGCEQCRKRHVKCDETGPPCANCIIRDTACSYRNSAPPHNTSSQLNLPQTTKTAAVFNVRIDSNETGVPLSINLHDLRLMHHWCRKTCNSFTTKHTEMFQNDVVIEALNHEGLMQAILALSSAHIACTMEDPIAKIPYIRSALQYHDQAISSLHSALHGVTPSRCGAIFASSMITMACAIVVPLLPRIGHDQDVGVPSIESVSHMFNFLKGISSVVDVSRHWLENGPFKTVFGAHFEQHSSMSHAESDALIRLLSSSNDRHHGARDPSRHQIYQRAINMLGTLLAIHKFKAFQWLLDSGEGIVDGLEAKDPMALVLFLHWGALLSQFHELWWAQHLGERLVNELSCFLSLHDIRQDDLAEWTKVQVKQIRP